MKVKARWIGVFLLMLPALAGAKLVTRTVEYKVGQETMKGYLAYDDGVKEQRPGVLVVPEWWGLDDRAKQRAREVAQLGYVAFAADMYGGGKTTRDAAQAKAWSEALATTRLSLALRSKPALDTLRRQPQTDPERLAAVGFGFGGTTLLQLAYAGAHLRGVASFHGTLAAPDSDEQRRIRAAILIVEGSGDAGAKPEAVDEMRKALDRVHVDWSMATYGRAQPARAERRSWAALKAFLAEHLK